MLAQSFDIESLLNFTPPKCLCQNCLGLWMRAPRVVNQRAVCPVCGVYYVPGGKYGRTDVLDYLADRGFGLEFSNFIEHAKDLALLARNLRMDAEGVIVFPPLRVLFQTMLSAERFIHFTSIGISPLILGALKLAAQKVPVRGIVTVVSDYLTKELTEFEDEAPRLDIRLFEYKMQPESGDMIPHQKIIVIDGLIAFKGSANLTVSGWRRAADARDIVETVTDIKQVIELHNRFFSPIWAEFSDASVIRMSDENLDPV